MPGDKRFIFDQVTWILLFGEFCVIASGNHRDQTFKARSDLRKTHAFTQ